MKKDLAFGEAGESQRVASEIAELLNSRAIRRIVIVDDDFDHFDDDQLRAAVLANIASIHDGIRAIGVSDTTFDFFDMFDDLLSGAELADRVDEVWTRLTPEQRSSLRPPGFTATESRDEASKFASIRPSFPKSIEYMFLGADQWTVRKTDLFHAGHPATLVLFDRDLSHSSLGSNGGELLVRSLYSENHIGVFSGIFTQEADNVSQELAITKSLSESIGKLVPTLGKWRAEDPAHFAAGLRVFLNISSLDSVKRTVLSSLESAFNDVDAYVRGVDFYTLLASAASAIDEGNIEVDGLVRMARNHFRKRVQIHLRDSLPGDDLTWIRRAAKTAISTQIPLSPEASRHVHDECFDSGEYLAQCRVPTDVGDIYEITDRQGLASYYILLAQPCDLMVRKGGFRQNSPDSFTLAKLEETEENKERGPRLIRVGVIDADDDRVWAVNLAKRVYVQPQLLDACVLDADGRARITSTSGEKPDSSSMTPGWQKMPGRLETWRRRIAEGVGELTSLLPDDVPIEHKNTIVAALQERALGTCFTSGVIRVSIEEDGTLEAGIRRTCRLVEAHAKTLLMQYSHYHARPDRPNDLIRDEPRSA